MKWIKNSNIFKKIFGSEQNISKNVSSEEKTIVYLRVTSTPAKFWESTVLYDAWGSPYVMGDYYHDFVPLALRENGKTDDSLQNTEWKHKSGPLVKFSDSDAPDYGWFPKE